MSLFFFQSWGESSKDWGTGIQSKNFRVGSPTFFASGGAAGGGRGGGAGSLMADLEGFSCSDSDDDWPDAAGSDSETDNQGRSRLSLYRGPKPNEYRTYQLVAVMKTERFWEIAYLVWMHIYRKG